MNRNQKHITLHSSLLIMINLLPPILHSASFNFQPYRRGRSLTLKKPFLFLPFPGKYVMLNSEYLAIIY